MQIKDILTERGEQYGSFVDFALITNEINAIVEKCSGYSYLMPYQKEAVRMIVHKLARILNGNPDYIDSWDDIAGYATLVATILRGDPIPGVKVEDDRCQT